VSDERISKLEDSMSRLLESGGASVTIQDPRVNKLYTALTTLFGSLILAAMLWIASSISGLKESVAAIVSQNAAIIETQRDHSDRIKELERNHASR
jgi:hypothetical protein